MIVLRITIASYALLAIVFLNASAIASPENDNNIIVYASHLNIETYVPVTPANIACRAQEKWVLARTGKGGQLIKLFTPSVNSGFTEKRTRVEVIDGETLYFIDAEGFVLRGNDHLRVDKQALQRFVAALGTNEKQANDHKGSCAHKYIRLW